MKISGHITAVEDQGDHLKITAQVCEDASGEAAWLKEMTFHVRAIDSNRHAAWVGRDIAIELRWK